MLLPKLLAAAGVRRPGRRASGFRNPAKNPPLRASPKRLFARRPAFAHKSDFFARHALHAMLMAIGDPNAASREETCQSVFRSPAPTDPLPFRVG